MIIKSIDLKDFRNYESLNLEFDRGTNILFGDNAQGKTNILEALYVCATSKSHKSVKDREIIRFGCEEAHLKMITQKNNLDYRIDMHLKHNKSKGIAINGIPIKKATELFGIINIIFFSPEDLNIIKNGPSDRRRFVDMELGQLDKIYLSNLINYNKVVNQRNCLLKDIFFNRTDEKIATLDIWDMHLVNYGSKIINRRREFIEQINPIIENIHNSLSGGRERLELRYEPNVGEAVFYDNIFSQRERDIKNKATGSGPHKDDIVFFINGKEVRKYGSQGQQRTAALSLKLSEIELVKNITGDVPVLLLDDVLSELDSSRQKFLLDAITDIQTIITCTGLEEFVNNRFGLDRIYRVAEGKVTETD